MWFSYTRYHPFRAVYVTIDDTARIGSTETPVYARLEGFPVEKEGSGVRSIRNDDLRNQRTSCDPSIAEPTTTCPSTGEIVDIPEDVVSER